MRFSKWARFALEHSKAVYSQFLNSTSENPGRLRQLAAPGPDTMMVDLIAENLLRRELERTGISARVRSEETGQWHVTSHDNDDSAVRIVMDPFDGSRLFKKGIETMWYSSIGMYRLDFAPLAACVIDLAVGGIYLSDTNLAFRAKSNLTSRNPNWIPLYPSTQRHLSEAYVGCYLMKPKYLNSSLSVFGRILQACAFIYPNGGPACVAAVASGELDAYIVNDERVEEVFSAYPIAEAAGVIFTDIQGEPIRFGRNLKKRITGVMSANRSIHKEILDLLARADKQRTLFPTGRILGHPSRRSNG